MKNYSERWQSRLIKFINKWGGVTIAVIISIVFVGVFIYAAVNQHVEVFENKEIGKINYLYSVKSQFINSKDLSGTFFFGTGKIETSDYGAKRYGEFYYTTKKNQVEYVCIPMDKIKIELRDTDKPYFVMYYTKNIFNCASNWQEQILYTIVFIKEDQITNRSLALNLH